jgi:hypothetical protein
MHPKVSAAKINKKTNKILGPITPPSFPAAAGILLVRRPSGGRRFTTFYKKLSINTIVANAKIT